MALSKFGDIKEKMCMKQGSPTIYQLTPEPEMVGSLKKISIGKKNPNMINKVILLVGETGTGKSTLINALMNQALGVQWEDDVWFHFVENEQQSDAQQGNQADSQTSDVIVYQLFGFEGKPLPCSLTIIDTPGYGDTRGNDRDDIVKLRLLELFRSANGIHEISAVGVVLKASENRVSDRLRYIYNSVMSLFGKDMEKNIVALITHSDGLPPENALQALQDAEVKLAKDEDDEPVYFCFNNRQDIQRTKKTKSALKAAWDMTMSGMVDFREFVHEGTPQNVQKTVEVLDTGVRLKACIQNLKERITWTEMKQREIKQTEEALEKFKEEIEHTKDFVIKVDEPYKARKKIYGGLWFYHWFYDAATTCSVCEENCHYPGCTWAPSPSRCQVMKGGYCTSCSRKCHVSNHVKEEWIYESKTRKVNMTLEEVKKKHDMNLEGKQKMSSLLDKLKEKVQQYQKEKDQFLEEAYGHVLNLDKMALNQNSVSTRGHLDFLIGKMREKREFEKARTMEEIRKRMDQTKGFKAAFKYVFGFK